MEKEERNEKQRIFQRRQKIQAILYYGGKCECCGEAKGEFLSIDHINGGGSKHRRKENTQISNWLRQRGYPKGYRVLCHNCNMAIGLYGECPHKTGKSKIRMEWTDSMKKSVKKALIKKI